MSDRRDATHGKKDKTRFGQQKFQKYWAKEPKTAGWNAGDSPRRVGDAGFDISKAAGENDDREYFN